MRTRLVILGLLIACAAVQAAPGAAVGKAPAPAVPTCETLKRLAEETGMAMAQVALGHCYETGEHFPQDAKEAARWYRLAAEKGLAVAQAKLGIALLQGSGVPRDPVEAAKWLGLAAGQGVASAQGMLGAMYADGIGVPQDYVRAHMWFSLAAASGESRAGAESRDEIARKMTPAQLAEAEKLAEACRARDLKEC